jgi:hypothetical protein
MQVGILYIKLVIREARGLKDKRQVVKSLKDRIHSKFNASVAEVDRQDSIQHAVLAVAVVGTDGRFVNSVLSGITDFTRRNYAPFFVDCEMEIF